LWLRRDPSGAFFLAPLRAWELLLGTLLSQSYLPSIHGKIQRNLASITGLLLILIPAFAYSSLTAFPGLAALPPCFGTVLIIASGETGDSFAGRMLAWKPFAFIGLISYSLYLWHWPILAFQDIVPLFARMSTHSKSGKFIFLIFTLSIAALSWRLVETPFRKGKLRPTRRVLFLVNGIAVILLTIGGIGILAVHGMIYGFPKEALALTPYMHYDSNKDWRHDVCFFTPERDFSRLSTSVCLQEAPTRKQFLLIGDSHAADLYPGLSRVFPELNISQANATFCPPFVTEPPLRPEFAPNCNQLSKYIFGDYLLHHHVDTVVLSAFWEETQMPELGRTIAWIKQHQMKVVVFGPSIEYTLPLPRIMIAALRDHTTGQIGAREKLDPRQLDATMAVLARDVWKVPYISVFEVLCSPPAELQSKTQPVEKTACPVYAAPGVPLLFDTNHFTTEGSILYAKRLRDGNLLPR
jgi:hypothetical protein